MYVVLEYELIISIFEFFDDRNIR